MEVHVAFNWFNKDKKVEDIPEHIHAINEIVAAFARRLVLLHELGVGEQFNVSYMLEGGYRLSADINFQHGFPPSVAPPEEVKLPPELENTIDTEPKSS